MSCTEALTERNSDSAEDKRSTSVFDLCFDFDLFFFSFLSFLASFRAFLAAWSASEGSAGFFRLGTVAVGEWGIVSGESTR